MGLNRVRLGDCLTLVERRNLDERYGIDDVRGVNNQKLMIRTKADVSARDFSKFQIVEPGEFFFNHRTSRNGSKLSITYNYDNEPHIVTEDYVVFRITDEDYLCPSWLYLYVCRAEYDRYAIQNSWGSSTEFFNWEDLCDTEIELPPIEIQRKYAAIYELMLVNQRSYERGLDDLTLACNILLDQCKRAEPRVCLGQVFAEIDRRNDDLMCKEAYGLNIEKRLMPSKVSSIDLRKYKLVGPGQFAYSSMQTGRDRCIRIALNNEGHDLAVSPAYTVLEAVNPEIEPRFVMMWLSRAEVDRLGWFCSDGSIRANLDLDRFYEIEIPQPDKRVQRSLAGLYNALNLRTLINERLKSRIKDVCPVLIRGSIEEASR